LKSRWLLDQVRLAREDFVIGYSRMSGTRIDIGEKA